MLTFADGRRTVAVTFAILTAVSGVVVFLRSILPSLPGPFLPLLFATVGATLLVIGRRLVRGARTSGARVAAGWAGFACSLGALGGANALGLGGGLVVVLLVVLFLNAVIALWFRSAVHFAVTQWLGFGWSIIAFVYGQVPLVGVVLAVAGLWWVGAVGFSGGVVVATTLLLPLTAALSLHSLTHSGAAIDAADVTTVAGLTAAAVLLGGRISRSQVYPGVWPAMRCTAVVALAAQTLVAAVPPVATLLAPADPRPGVWLGAAILSVAVAVACLSELRPGAWAVIGWAGLLWGTIALDVALGARVGCLAGLTVVIVILLVSVARADELTLGSLARLAGSAVVAGAALLLLAPPPPIAAAALLLLAAAMVAVVLRPRDARVGILR